MSTRDASAVTCRSVPELRRFLAPSLQSRRAKWIALHGLSADDARQHSALQTSLRCVGFYGDTGEAAPELIVLDWSTASDCSADGLAMLPVLVSALRERNVATVICAPASGGVGRLSEDMHLRALCGDCEWIADAASGNLGARPLAAAAAFASIGDRSDLERFIGQIEAVLPTLGGRYDEIEMVFALLNEALQNVRSHARAKRAAVTALLQTHRRPPRLEFGLADNGPGVSANVLAQERYAWLAAFTDASVTETVLDRQFTGRDDGAGGGGFGTLLKETLEQTSATVVLRTGAAHLNFSSAEPTRYRRTSLTYGFGTQLKIELRLRPV